MTGTKGAPTAPLPGEPDPTEISAKARYSPKRIIQATIGLVLAIVMLIWGLPHFAKTTWSSVWQVLGTVTLWQGIGFATLVIVGLYCYTFVMTGAMPGLSHPRALVMNVCGSSVSNLLPGGGAVGLAATYSIGRSWGFSNASVTTMAIVTGVWNVLARVALPVVAIITLSIGATNLPPVMREAAIAGSITGIGIMAVFVGALFSSRVARVVGHGVDVLVTQVLRHKAEPRRYENALLGMRSRITGVVRKGWLPMTLGMAGFFGFYYILFVLCAQVTGVTLPYGQLFAAFAIGRLLTAVGITPGGLGVTETGTAAALVAWGADPATAMACVVLFSIYTHIMEIPLGALGWLAWSIMPKADAAEIADAG